MKLGTNQKSAAQIKRPQQKEKPSLGDFFEPQGAFDGKLLFKGDKITYVFLEAPNVISIHFDKSRQEIYYNGHQVVNLDLTEVEWMHLEKFRQSIEHHSQACESYLAPYEEVLKNLAYK